jgi:hypothetical protein
VARECLLRVQEYLWRCPDEHHWLRQVVRGHYQGLLCNFRGLGAFYHEVRRLWFRALQRRSQRRLSWDAYRAVLQLFPLPTASGCPWSGFRSYSAAQV